MGIDEMAEYESTRLFHLTPVTISGTN